jgi:hypothetical protein
VRSKLGILASFAKRVSIGAGYSYADLTNKQVAAAPLRPHPHEDRSANDIGSQDVPKKSKLSPDRKAARPSGKFACGRDDRPPALVLCQNFPPKTPPSLFFTPLFPVKKNPKQ